MEAEIVALSPLRLAFVGAYPVPKPGTYAVQLDPEHKSAAAVLSDLRRMTSANFSDKEAMEMLSWIDWAMVGLEFFCFQVVRP